MLRDLKGYTNSSLKNLAESLNILMESKDLLEEYKSCMDIALKDHTDVFLKYCLDDVIVTYKIFNAELIIVNK